VTTLRIEEKDYGGVEIWDDSTPDVPVYLSPAIQDEYYAAGELTAAGQIFVNSVLLHRHDSQEDL